MNTPWLCCPQPRPRARLRLFCFPCAGRGASLYAPWARQMPEGVEVVAAQLPGRETRWREAPLTRLGAVVAALADVVRPHLDRPFAFFGYSMGALVAFELARRLRTERSPAHLFVAACRAPQLPPREPLHTLPDDDFRRAVERLNGIPRELAGCADVLASLLPRLRADLAACETYAHAPGRPLDCPLTAFGGADDPVVSRSELEAWRGQTRAAFRLELFRGDHFFLHSAEADLLRRLGDALSAAGEDGGSPSVPRPGELRPDEVHVWQLALDRPEEEVRRLASLLSADELRRAGALHFAADRARAVAARGLLRELLGRYLGRDPAALRFAYGAQGKPALDEDADLRFNLSHAEGLALVAVARGREVGVDLERVRADFPAERVAARFFSPRELAELQALPAERRREAFFAGWTRKEAYLKATGTGLALAPDSFDVTITPAAPARLLAARHDPAAARRWSLCALAPAPGYVGALAVEGAGWRLCEGRWTELLDLDHPVDRRDLQYPRVVVDADALADRRRHVDQQLGAAP